MPENNETFKGLLRFMKSYNRRVKKLATDLERRVAWRPEDPKAKR